MEERKMENIEFENAKKAMIKKIEFQKIRVELEKIGLVKVFDPYSNDRQKNIKKYLKYKFPDLKISVRKECGSMVDGVFIEVESDRETAYKVDKAVRVFCSGHSDSYTDYYWNERNEFQDYFGGFQYVTAQAKYY